MLDGRDFQLIAKLLGNQKRDHGGDLQNVCGSEEGDHTRGGGSDRGGGPEKGPINIRALSFKLILTEKCIPAP